jgi:hypothetical protein
LIGTQTDQKTTISRSSARPTTTAMYLGTTRVDEVEIP